jgi:hypothetical protein
VVVEDITKGIEDELRTQIARYDGLLSKHVITEKKLAKVKRSFKDKINTDKEILDSLKKERENLRKNLGVEKGEKLVRQD